MIASADTLQVFVSVRVCGVSVCVRVRLRACCGIYLYTHACMCVHICVCMHVCICAMWLCACVCMLVHIYSPFGESKSR